MCPHDLEDRFVQAFGATPSRISDEIYWTHGLTKYRLLYRAQELEPRTTWNSPPLYVRHMALHHTGGRLVVPRRQDLRLGTSDWDPTATAEQAAQWVAKIILTYDYM